MKQRHRFTLLTICGIVTLGFMLMPLHSMAAAPRPNVLLILADDLGYSDIGCFGGEIATPNLDKLAENGLRLNSLYNTGRCCPTRASLLTGQYPHRIGLGHMVKNLGQPGYRGTLAAESRTIAQVLASAGYRSFISGKWHLGTPDPTEHGFEEFFGTLTSAQTFWDAAHYLRLPAGRTARHYPDHSFYGTEAVTDHALDFLDEARTTPAKPWFLYLAYHSPHFPLQAKREDISRYEATYQVGWDRIRENRIARMKMLGLLPPETALTPRSPYTSWEEAVDETNPEWTSLPVDRRADLAQRMAIYAAMIQCMDRNIGRVIESLRQRDELDDTLVLFLSDNGACAEWDPFGFDGKSGPENKLHPKQELARMGGPGTYHSFGSGWANAANTPWRLYKHYTHEGGISTPCIAHWPSVIERKGEIERQAAHIIDILPTLMSVAGATDAGPLPPAGTSLLPLFMGEAQPSRALYFEHEGNRAVIDGPWKLVSQRHGQWELYDLTRDRTELIDLASKHPAVVERLDAKWQQWASEQQVLPLPADYGVGYLKPIASAD